MLTNPMTTDVLPADALLTLTRWLSPAYPTGAFAWSHGLEAAVAAGEVSNVPSLAGWIDVMLRHGSGRSDAILIGCAHRADAPDALAEVASYADALAPTRERRAEALALGAAFAATIRAVEGWDLPDMAYPVALGRAARLGQLPARAVAQVALLAAVTNLTQAAQRLMRLGQSDAQRIIAGLAPACAEGADLAEIGSAAFAIDIASMRHEILEPRLFRA